MGKRASAADGVETLEEAKKIIRTLEKIERSLRRQIAKLRDENSAGKPPQDPPKSNMPPAAYMPPPPYNGPMPRPDEGDHTEPDFPPINTPGYPPANYAPPPQIQVHKGGKKGKKK